MILEEQVVAIRDGEIVDTGSWVYAWQRPHTGEIVYVGATRLSPAVRCWLHLEAADPNVARSGTSIPTHWPGTSVFVPFVSTRVSIGAS